MVTAHCNNTLAVQNDVDTKSKHSYRTALEIFCCDAIWTLEDTTRESTSPDWSSLTCKLCRLRDSCKCLQTTLNKQRVSVLNRLMNWWYIRLVSTVFRPIRQRCPPNQVISRFITRENLRLASYSRRNQRQWLWALCAGAWHWMHYANVLRPFKQPIAKCQSALECSKVASRMYQKCAQSNTVLWNRLSDKKKQLLLCSAATTKLFFWEHCQTWL